MDEQTESALAGRRRRLLDKLRWEITRYGFRLELEEETKLMGLVERLEEDRTDGR